MPNSTRDPQGRSQLLLFCKPPRPGLVKTRLGKVIGMQRAARIYSELLRRVAVPFLQPGDRSRRIAVQLYSATDDPESRAELRAVFQGTPGASLPDSAIAPQSGEDLGLRMANAALEAARKAGPDQAVVVAGTDIPGLEPGHVEATVEILEARKADVVLGPTVDGGYYLIGLGPDVLASAQLVRDLFADIPWSTERVFALQQERARNLGLKTQTLTELFDLDTFDDLAAWRASGKDFYLEAHFPDVRVVIPIFNERENLAFVLKPLLQSGLFREVICADNNSTDGSRELAEELGARVTVCTRRGYGATCLTALADIRQRGGCEVVLFTDGDGADHPTEAVKLLAPITAGEQDFVIGFRDPRLAEAGALLPQARFGNWLAVNLMTLVWRHRFSDLGPYRAIAWEALESLRMDDMNFGWTIQMQIRAVVKKLRIREIAVPYRRRHAGKSKVTANLKAIFQAGFIIIWTIFRELGVGRRLR